MRKKLGFDDVFIRPSLSDISSRKEVNLEREFKFRHSPRVLTCVPMMVANMATTGTMKMGLECAKSKVITCLHKFYTLDELYEFYSKLPDEYFPYVWITTGIRAEDLRKLDDLSLRLKTGGYHPIPNISIDIANAHGSRLVSVLRDIRSKFTQPIIMCGNVCIPEAVKLLGDNGADVIKLGIGGGNQCLTSIKTGVAYPPISCIQECISEFQVNKICWDGGIRNPGDLCKCYVAGADFAMMGSLFAGTDECDGWEDIQEELPDYYEHAYSAYSFEFPRYYATHLEAGTFTNLSDDSIGGIAKIVTHDSTLDKITKIVGRRLKHYGMSSDHAKETHYGHIPEYATSEGKVSYIDPKGPVSLVLKDLMGGLRSCGAYVNANTIDKFRQGILLRK